MRGRRRLIGEVPPAGVLARRSRVGAARASGVGCKPRKRLDRAPSWIIAVVAGTSASAPTASCSAVVGRGDFACQSAATSTPSSASTSSSRTGGFEKAIISQATTEHLGSKPSTPNAWAPNGMHNASDHMLSCCSGFLRLIMYASKQSGYHKRSSTSKGTRSSERKHEINM